jgi:hypothetical protein
MAKNNFDDFLLDPTFDDLDAIHQEAERQLYQDGGISKRDKRAVKRIGKAVKKGKLKKAARISGRLKKRTDKKFDKNDPLQKNIKQYQKNNKPQAGGGAIVKPENNKSSGVTKTKPEDAAPQGANNAPGKTKTKRGTGVTYESAWRDNKNNVKSKYKNYAAFESAAKAWNKKEDAKKSKKTTPKKTTPPKKKNASASTVTKTEAKKLTSKNLFDKIPTGNKMEKGGVKRPLNKKLRPY